MSFKKNFLYTELIKKPAKKILCFLRGVRSGSNTFISLKAEIVNPVKIELGSNVAVEKHARLVCIGDSCGIRVGDDTFILPYALLKADHGRIRIGKNCTVNDYTVLLGRGDLIIGDDVRIAPHCVIVAMNHIYKNPDVPISSQGMSSKGITIEDDVWIGASAVILDGVKIGKGSVVGAGSVVAESIPAYSVAAGVPAKIIKQRK